MNVFFVKKIILFCCLFFLMPGCKKTVSNARSGSRYNRPHLNRRKEKLVSYALKVDGIECVFCAHDAVNRVRRIPGVKNVEFCTVNNRYEEGSLVFSWNINKGNPNIRTFAFVLGTLDFTLTSMSGEFAGVFNNDTGQPQFIFTESDQIFDVYNGQREEVDLMQAFQQFKAAKNETVLGTLSLMSDIKKYVFSTM